MFVLKGALRGSYNERFSNSSIAIDATPMYNDKHKDVGLHFLVNGMTIYFRNWKRSKNSDKPVLVSEQCVHVKFDHVQLLVRVCVSDEYWDIPEIGFEYFKNFMIAQFSLSAKEADMMMADCRTERHGAEFTECNRFSAEVNAVYRPDDKHIIEKNSGKCYDRLMHMLDCHLRYITMTSGGLGFYS